VHILLLNDDSPMETRGGAAIVVERLRRECIRQGHRVTLIVTHQDRIQENIVRKRDTHGDIISLFRDYSLAKRARLSLRSPEIEKTLSKLLSELRPDVVNAHNIHTYLSYGSLLIASEYTKKVFLTAHDTFLVSFDRVRGEKMHLNFIDHLKVAGRKYWPLRNITIRSILRETGTKIIAISFATKSFLEENGIAVAKVIHNGIGVKPLPQEDSLRAFREKYQIRGPTVLFGGRVSQDKGIGVLLSAMEIVMKELPQAQLLLVGEKSRIEPELKNISSTLRSAIRLTGWIPHEDMRIAYASADLVTTPSIYLDNFPNVNLEAMEVAKPVIGTSRGGTPEVVEDNVTGIILDPKDTKKFADTLLTLLRDHAKAKKMGEAGRKSIEEKFSLELQAKSYLQLFSA